MGFSRFVSAVQKIVSSAPVASKTVVTNTVSSSASFINALINVAQQTAPKPVTQQAPQTTTVSLAKNTRIPVPNLTQGYNECGPTSLAMVLKYYGTSVNYHSMFPSDMIGHDPVSLREKAVGYGMNVKEGNNGNVNDLAALIDAGIPPMILGSYNGNSNTSIPAYITNISLSHYMVVSGYIRNSSGQITNVYVNDPNNSSPQLLSVDKFNKFWQSNVIPGGNCYYMAMAKRGDYREYALNKTMPADRLTSTYRKNLNIAHDMFNSIYAANRSITKAINLTQGVASNFTKSLKSLFG